MGKSVETESAFVVVRAGVMARGTGWLLFLGRKKCPRPLVGCGVPPRGAESCPLHGEWRPRWLDVNAAAK